MSHTTLDQLITAVVGSDTGIGTGPTWLIQGYLRANTRQEREDAAVLLSLAPENRPGEDAAMTVRLHCPAV